MDATDPACPFNLVHLLGVRVVGSTEPLPVPVLYDTTHHVAVVSPGYDHEAYCVAADWLLLAALQHSATV